MNNQKAKNIGFYLVTTVLYVVVMLITYMAWTKNEDTESKEDAYALVDTIDAALYRNTLIAKQASDYIEAECTPEVIRKLSHYAASNDSLRAVNIIKDNKWFCSSLDGSGPIELPLKDKKELYIDSVTRNGVPLYIIFYPFINGKVAIALYQTSLDKLLKIKSSEMRRDVFASLSPLSGQGVVGSSEFPYWVKVRSDYNIVTFISSQYVTLLISTLFLMTAYFMRYVYHRNSPLLAIKTALRNGEIKPYYQAIVDLNSEKIIGAEVLVRWVHPQQGMIAPDEFIPMAEKHGVISRLTTTLMDRVSEDMSNLRTSHKASFHIAINISPPSLNQDNFVDNCLAFSKKMRSLFIQTNLEITEREQNVISPEIFKLISENEIDISLDDFGTGYSNYESISRVNPAYLKVDRMFVASIGTNSINESILRHIIMFSQELGIPNVAEGIETQEQHTALKSMGVQYAQGYFYGKPMPFNDFITNLNENI